MTVRPPTDASLEVEIRGLISQPYLGKRVHALVGDVGSGVQQGYAELFAKLAAAGVAPTGPPFLVASKPDHGAMEIELGVPCAAPPATGELYAGTLPGGRAAATTYRGAYAAMGPTYDALSQWILANGHTMAGPPREIYLTGPDVASPEEQVTELIWPIG